MDPEVITFSKLQVALTRCMAAHPPEGVERRLHPDANRLADLFGLMIYDRSEQVDRANVEADIVEIFDRYLAAEPTYGVKE